MHETKCKDVIEATKNFESDDENWMPFSWIEGDSLAPPCQSEAEIVGDILSFANITSDDVVYDLGCGDGRICIQAAKNFNARAVGIEIEPHLISEFEANVKRESLQDLVTVQSGDLLDFDFAKHATVVFTYLLPEAMAKIAPSLIACINKPGCRVICSTWGIPAMAASRRKDIGKYGNTTLMLYEKLDN